MKYKYEIPIDPIYKVLGIIGLILLVGISVLFLEASLHHDRYYKFNKASQEVTTKPNVKTYRIEVNTDDSCSCLHHTMIVEHPDGQWVRRKDYEQKHQAY